MRVRRVRRRRIAIAGLLATALVVAACSDPPTAGNAGEAQAGGNGDDGGDAALPECPLDALDGADGPVEIELWYAGLAGTLDVVMRDMVTRFNASQDDVRLIASQQGAAYQEVERAYESAAATPDQLPDLVYMEDTTLQSLVDDGTVLPAEACMEAADYDPTNLDAAARAKYTVDDVLYPGYMNVSTPVLYYNKAHWAQAGLDPDAPPGTLEELREQARALKAAGVSDRPFALQLNRWYFETWLSGIGQDIVDNDNGYGGRAAEATFDTPEARELLAFLDAMNDEGLLNVFTNTEGNIDHFLALAQEQSSMVLETSAASGTIRDALAGTITAEQAGVDVDDSFLATADIVPGSGPFPGIDAPGRVFASGGAFYMLNHSEPERQAAAWRFLEFMLQPENALDWHVTAGYLPVVKAVADEPAVQAFRQDDVAGVLLGPSVEQLADADPDLPGPLIGPHPDEKRALEGAMEAILLDGADIGATLAAAQDDLTESLQRYAGE
jgi:sn-glycerol 3-phosphate transport system substrate-binding protein